jgi:hypothetical protein
MMGNLQKDNQMRQWYVDAWQVYGYDLFEQFTALWGAGSDMWWIALRIAGNLMDVDWDLNHISEGLKEYENLR